MAKSEIEKILLPEGRLINSALFEKETYTNEKGEEGKPKYKVEIAFTPADLAEVEQKIIDAAVAEWGTDAEKEYDNGELTSPLLDGDRLAKNRERKGKAGEAYVGKLVIRASTGFNKNGQDGPGGVYVADETAKEVAFNEKHTVYNGCYGRAVVTISTYNDKGKNALNFYLVAFQKTRDGEPLRASTDYSTLFQPSAKTPAAGVAGADTGRKRRATG